MRTSSIIFISFLLISGLFLFSGCKKEDPSNVPVITISGSNPIIQCVGVPYVDPGATAWDEEDGDISANIQVEIDVSTIAPGGGNVIYIVTDSDGNTTTATRTIQVIYCK